MPHARLQNAKDVCMLHGFIGRVCASASVYTVCLSISEIVPQSRTLLSHLLVLPPGDVLPPGFLDDSGEGVELPVPRLFQQKQL